MLRNDERKRMKNADGQGAGRCAGGAPGGSAALLGIRLAGETHCHAAGPPLSGGADGGGRAEAAPPGAEEAAPSLNRQREAPQGLLLLRMYSC